MLSTFYAMSCSNNQRYDVSIVIMLVVLLLIIDITLMVWAFYCLVDCVNQGLISIPLAVILGMLLFVPAFGIVVPVGIIIYHALNCKKHALDMTTVAGVRPAFL